MAPTDRSYRTALICGLAPLAIGVAIFVLWLATGWTWLMFAGLATVFCGSLSFLAGAISLFQFAAQAAALDPRPRIAPRVALGLAALLVNLPAAFLIIVAANYLFFSVDVIVVNRGPDFDRLVVAGGCAQADFGRLPSGATRTERVVIECDGSLDFQAERGGEKLSGTLVGYVTNSEQLIVHVTFAPDGTWSVTESFK